MNFFDAMGPEDFGQGMMNGFRMMAMVEQEKRARQQMQQEYELQKMVKQEQALKLKAQREAMEGRDRFFQDLQPQTTTTATRTWEHNPVNYETGEQQPAMAPTVDTTTTQTTSPAYDWLVRTHGPEQAEAIRAIGQYDPTTAFKMAMEKPKDRFMSVGEGQTVFDVSTGQPVFQGAPKQQRPVPVPPGGILAHPVTGQPMFQNPIKPPTGFRATGTGDLEPIPGGPADIKGQNAASQATASMSNATEALNRLGQAVNALINHPGLGRITGIMGKVPNMPGSDASNAQALLENIKSQAGFAVLQNMRDMSKTGGALGQVSDFENRMLQSNLAALDQAQSLPEFKKNLQKVLDYVEGAKGRLGKAYEQSYYGKRSPVNRMSSPPASGARQAPDGNWYVPDPNRPGKYMQVVE